MTYEKETLRQLRISLYEEEDETSIIPILQNHHKYLKEYIPILMSNSTSFKEKQAIVSLFLPILNMHAKSEEEIFYRALKESSNKEVRLEGLRGQDEHELMHEIIKELKLLGAESSWSEIIDAKMYVLAGLVQSHLRQEEEVIFGLAEKHISESTLIVLTDDYLDRCKMYLDLAMDDTVMEVSRTDVISFFY